VYEGQLGEPGPSCWARSSFKILTTRQLMTFITNICWYKCPVYRTLFHLFAVEIL